MVKKYNHLLVEQKNGLMTIWLNRPDVHNAFNLDTIIELEDVFRDLAKNTENIVVIIKGKGKSFCAGADVNWMQNAGNLQWNENLNECKALSNLFHKIYTCHKTTIACVHGSAFGGGIGLLSACDLAFCDKESHFSLSELKLGVVAASISPFVYKKLGEAKTKEYMLTSKKFDGSEAERIGLVNKAVKNDELESIVNNTAHMILKGAPQARTTCKNLIHDISAGIINPAAIEQTAGILAKIRLKEEALEGFAAFLDKRQPNWIAS